MRSGTIVAYLCSLGPGQQIYVENQGQQTVITMVSSGQNQQQTQRRSFTTGTWTAPPVAFGTSNNIVLRIETAQSQQFVELTANGTIAIGTAPAIADTELVPMQEASLPSGLQAMEPMKPMEPMKMRDMEMRMNPMEMRMGDMTLSLGTPTQADKHFCPQCGAIAVSSDRFCSNCGHRLGS